MHIASVVAGAAVGLWTQQDLTGGLRLEVLTAEADLRGLEPEWTALWLSLPDASPFLSPHWLLAWWRHLGGGELRVATARTRAGARLVAVLPMFIYGDPSLNGLRRLLPMGISYSDRFDLLAGDGQGEVVVQALLHSLSVAGGWDQIEFHEISATSPLLRGLQGVAVRQQSVSPVLDLRAYAAAGVREGRVRRLRRARRGVGPGTWLERISADDIQATLEELFDLHARRWEVVGLPGVLGDARVQAHHREAASALQREGALLLLRLRTGNTTAGVLYGFGHGYRVSLYALGTDPAARSLQPGTLLIGTAIELAIARGCIELDFLRGAEPYKYAWGAADEFTFEAVVRPRPDCPPGGV